MRRFRKPIKGQLFRRFESSRLRQIVMNPIIKKPSAWIPIALSLVVLTTMIIYIGTHSTSKPQTDEGTGAHLFQLWLVAEVFLISIFAIKWLPHNRKQALRVLALQIVTVLLPMAIVFSLHL